MNATMYQMDLVSGGDHMGFWQYSWWLYTWGGDDGVWSRDGGAWREEGEVRFSEWGGEGGITCQQ